MRVTPLLLVLATLAGCVQSATPDAQAIAFRTVDSGDRSGVIEPTRALLADEPAWDGFWSKHRSDAPRPSVDIPRESAIAVVLGERSAGCWAIRVTGVRLDGQEVVVEVTIFDEGRSAGCASADTSAYHIVAIDGRPGGARFVEKHVAGRPA